LSPFTQALVDRIETPDLEITDLMRDVRLRVREFSQRVSAFTNEVKHRRNTGLFSRLGLRFLINACFGELG
jgi:hypothetical protein